MRNALTMVMALLLPLAAQANAPIELQKTFRSPQPYGEAEFSYLWMDVYRIALWTDEAVWSADSRYALSISYRMGFTSDELLERTCDEMQRHRADGRKLCSSLRAPLMKAMPDVAKGDRITALRGDDGATMFYKNGRKTGVIDDAAFTEAFFAIWLGEKTSEPAMRRELLGKR